MGCAFNDQRCCGWIPQKLSTLTLLLIASLLTPALPSVAVGADQGSETEAAIRIAGSTWIHDAPTRIADLQGHFQGPGPGIEMTPQTSGKAALRQLMSGNAEFALAAATPVAKTLLESPTGNQARPDDPVILATISLSNQTHHVLAISERGITTPSDLMGRRVGVLFDTSADFFWSLFTLMHGLEADSIERVDLELEDMTQALNAGEVDAVVLWDPWLHWIQQALELETTVFSERQIYTLNWFLISRRQWVLDHPELAERVVRGYIQSIESLLRDPQQAASYPRKETDLPAEYLETLRDRVIFHLGLNWSVINSMEQSLDWLIEFRGMDGSRRPGPEIYIEPGPLSRVAPRRLLLPDIWTPQRSEDAP